MTPGARWAAAAQIMDDITDGAPAEKALTNWARRSRFAGSKDRAAVRDHVFDILRCWRSAAAHGGGTTGRHLVLGQLRQTDVDPDTVFTGDGYALTQLSEQEKASGTEPTGADDWDLPDWLYSMFISDLGGDAHLHANALKTRAPAFLRVNTLKTDRDTVLQQLAEAGIEARPHKLSETALEVTEGARRIAQSTPYITGLVELQDAASQAVVDALPLSAGMRVLDYCAGGGGKTLAMAARLQGPVEAHDANPGRMTDLPSRAERAGADVTIVDTPNGRYDLVLCDVPCSGSGAWRRSPEGKWRLTPERLEDITSTQSAILDDVVDHVSPNGVLAYVTCSVLRSENSGQIDAFLSRHEGWAKSLERTFSPQDGGDGFFLCLLTRTA